ncbi:MAG: hypothetical protein ACREX8_14255, partial [Gammaproteobacteria bacterium]
VPLTRPGRFAAFVPSPPAGPPPALSAPVSRRSPLVRRGRYFVASPLPPPGPAPLVPALHRRHRSRLLPVYRGTVAWIPLEGLAPIPASTGAAFRAVRPHDPNRPRLPRGYDTTGRTGYWP